jgi:hypothetical protein
MVDVLRTYTAAAMLLSMVIASSGCLKMEHDLRIKEDGTATYRLQYSISEQAIVQLRAMNKLKADLAKASGEPPPGIEMDPLLYLFLDPDEGALREAIKKYEADGIKLKQLEVESRSAWRSVDLRLDIDDLAKVAETEFFKTHGFNLTPDKEAGRYVFSRAPHINIPGQVAKAPTDEDIKQMIPIVAGFNTTVKITTPGRILATTAFRTTLHTASWVFDFDNEPGAIQAVQRQPFRILFESKATSLPVMRYRGSKIKR